MEESRKKMEIILLMVLILVLGFGYYYIKNIGTNMEDSHLQVKILEVGKADAIIMSVYDKTILIDTATTEEEDKVVSALKGKGITHLDYLILTHMDKDHIGGAATIIRQFEIGEVIYADYIKNSDEYEALIEAIQNKDQNSTALHEKKAIQIDDIKLVLSPAKEENYEDSNDYSIMVDVVYGTQKFLFAGDAYEKRLKEFLEENSDTYTFLKVPHHGNYNNQTEEFIKSVKPTYSVITCASVKKVDKETIALLKKYNSKVYYTCNGVVTVQSDGTKTIISQ